MTCEEVQVEHEGEIFKGKWSGEESPPKVKTRINVHMNNFGPCVVTGYGVKHGYLHLRTKVLAPPIWWEDQQTQKEVRPSRGYGGFFGCDFTILPPRKEHLIRGLDHSIPDTVTTAWGGRAIWSNRGDFDLPHDRNGGFGEDIEELTTEIKTRWDEIQRGYKTVKSLGLLSSSEAIVNLIRDDRYSKFRVLASPNGSHGHLYLAAWLVK